MKTFTLVPFAAAALAEVIPFGSALASHREPEPFGQAPFGEVIPFTLPRDPAAINSVADVTEIDFAEIVPLAA